MFLLKILRPSCSDFDTRSYDLGDTLHPLDEAASESTVKTYREDLENLSRFDDQEDLLVDYLNGP